ncbi:hypothetical protein GW17_00006618 [Ensete ventricosum]|nr:hypothetical protein GW17_00006618 [Ensete ventricosum]
MHGPFATGRYRQKSIVGDRLREKKGRRRSGKEEKIRGEEEPTFHVTSSPAHHCRPQVARVPSPASAFSPSVSSRGEKDRGDFGLSILVLQFCLFSIFQDLAFDLSLSALLGDNIYNFGELLAHPIVR